LIAFSEKAPSKLDKESRPCAAGCAPSVKEGEKTTLLLLMIDVKHGMTSL
jgi:hypothetical protein